MSRHRSRCSWENGWFRCIDNHTACISYQGLSRLQMRDWSRIAPLLKKFLQKERDSQILLQPLLCLSGLIHILIFNTKRGENPTWRNPEQVAQVLKSYICNSFAELRFIKKLPLKLNFSPFVTILYNFGVSSEYDAEEGSLRLYVTNVNDALQILAAKE